MQNLSAELLESLQPPEAGRIEISDTIQRGLKFRLTCKGVATWSLQLNVQGRKRRFTIGAYPAIGLSEARRRAEKLRVEVLDGHDPIEARRAAQRGQKNIVTVGDALSAYNRSHLQPNLRRGQERRLQLERSLDEVISLPIEQLDRIDLQRFIDEKARVAAVAANRLRAALTAFVGWCWRRGYVESNFALATTPACRERPRERVLTREELQAIFRASSQLGGPWSPFLELLLLTAQRRGDVAHMAWSDINFDQRRWGIPGKKTKNARPHIVPLTERCQQVLLELQHSADPSHSLVFTTTGSTPISGFSRMKKRLDRISGVGDWRVHDIRTAFATHMAEAGFDEGVVDRVLNHAASASSASTIARVYNQAERLSDRARALDYWADWLQATEGTICNVVSLPIGRSRN